MHTWAGNDNEGVPPEYADGSTGYGIFDHARSTRKVTATQRSPEPSTLHAAPSLEASVPVLSLSRSREVITSQVTASEVSASEVTASKVTASEAMAPEAVEPDAAPFGLPPSDVLPQASDSELEDLFSPKPDPKDFKSFMASGSTSGRARLLTRAGLAVAVVATISILAALLVPTTNDDRIASEGSSGTLAAVGGQPNNQDNIGGSAPSSSPQPYADRESVRAPGELINDTADTDAADTDAEATDTDADADADADDDGTSSTDTSSSAGSATATSPALPSPAAGPAGPTTVSTAATTATTKPDPTTPTTASSTTAPTTASTTTPTTAPTTAPAPAPCSGGAAWDLVLDEQFNGSSLNTSVWAPYNSSGNAGHGLRRPAAISVGNGMLNITASMVDGTLVSGGMQHRHNQQYGRYEFRVRTDQDLSESTSGVVLTWPQSNAHPRDGENNIYETLATPGNRQEFFSFIHKPYGSVHDQDYTVHRTSASAWHTMAMEWTPGVVRIYRDGALVKTLNETNADLIPDNPHFLAIQLDAWKNSVAQNVSMQVDYVKVWSHRGGC